MEVCFPIYITLNCVVPSKKQIFMLLLMPMCIYREKQKYMQDSHCTERYLTKTQLLLGYNLYKGNVSFS